MTSRLNKKLIIIVCACVVVVGAGLSGGWLLARRARAGAAFREAEAAMAAGDFELAIRRYANAVRHRDYSENVDLMLNASEAHRQIQVSQMREARRHLGQMLQWLRMAIRVNPHDGRALQRRMVLGMRMGREFGAATIWDAMYHDTQELLRQYSDLPLAVKYRGISQVQRMVLASTNLTAEQRSQAGLDLGTALEQFGFERETVEHLAVWHQLEADRLEGLGGDEVEASHHRNEALKLTDRGVADHSDDPHWLVVHITNLYHLGDHDQARSLLETLQRLLSQELADPRVARKAAALILRLHGRTRTARDRARTRRVVQRCGALLQGVLERNPDSSSLKVVLARIHMHLGERDRARILFEQVWQSRPAGNPFEFVNQKGVWAEGGLGYLELALFDARSVTDREQREQRLAEIEQGLARIKANVGDIAAVSDVAGLLSVVRGNWVKAGIEFDHLSDRLGEDHVEPLERSAAVRFKLGEWGAAADNYRRILEIRPGRADIRKQLARVFLVGRRFDEADEQIETLLKADPDDPSVRLIQFESLIRQKQFDEADSLMQQLDVAFSSDEAVALGQLYVGAGRSDTARKLFLRSFRRDPRHIPALFALVNLTQDHSEKLAYIEQSRKAGGDAQRLEAVTQFVDGDLDPEEEFLRRRRDALKHLSDPVIATVREYERHIEENKRAAADNILSRLDHDGGVYLLVVHNLFRQALARKDWQTAQSMTALARDARGGQGADIAKGAFYLGRLDMARGQFDQAVAHFRAGLERRPIYSHGWRMLGDALVEVKEIEPAIAAYRSAVSQRPDSLRALVSLARAYDQRGEPRDALNVLRQAYQYNSDNYKVTNVYLDFELRHGDAERALNLRRKIAEDEPDNLHNRRAVVATLTHMRRRRDAIAEAETLVAETGPSTANDIVMSRVMALTHGPSAAAEVLFGTIQDNSEPVSSDDYRRIGRRMMELGNEAYALSAYRQAISSEEPNTRPATRELADLLSRSDDGAGEAAELYRKLLEEFPSEVRIARAHILRLLKMDRFDEAETQLKKLVAAHGEDLSALMLSAQLHAQRGHLDEAMAACDRAIELAPRRASLYATKAGLVARDPQRHGEALSIVDRAIALDPMLVSARHLRSRIYRRQGDMDAAIREYEQLLDKSPRQARARLELAELYGAVNQSRKLETLLAESAKLYPSDPVWPQRQAAAAMRRNDVETALRKLDLAFELDPKPCALFSLVSLHLTAVEPADALQALDANRTLVASEPRLQAQRGRALWMMDRKKDATSVFVEALRQADRVDQFASTRDQIVTIYGLAGTAKLMLATFGSSPPFIVQVAIAELHLTGGRFDAAVSRLRGLNSQVSDVSTEKQIYFQQTYATALHRAGNSEQAETAYRQLLALRPDSATVLNNLAFLLVDQLERPSEAAAVAERALRLRPNNPSVMDALGWSLFKTGEVDRSRHMLEACYRLRPSAGVSLHLADVLEHLGLDQDAIDILISGKALAEHSRDALSLRLINERLERLGG